MHNTIRWAAVMILALASPALYALGLGSAKVNSFLNQPLDVRVELISQSSEELQSVTAGLASAKDFEMLGLKLNSISVPLAFEIVTDGNKSYIHITSNLNVTSPVMQVLVEVVWANGRMLREYTLFLDPPTFASKAPAPPVTKAAAAPVATASPVAVQTPPQQLSPRQSVPAQPPVSESAAMSLTDVSGDSSAAEPADKPADSASDSAQEIRSADATSRVGKGQTLWGIARDWSRGTVYDVNQTMIAIQHKNPDAFIDDNINLLKQGEILRMPANDEMAAITAQQAALEVQRQATVFSQGPSIADFATPTVADSGDYQETFQDDVSATEADFIEGRLEIVPPSDADNDAMGAISQASDEVTADNVESQALLEKLSRTEEELINAELENSYLKDRIAELEQQAEADKSLQLQDAALADMEQALADKQASDEPEPPVALTPGGESQPWYAGVSVWLMAAGLLFILLVAWFLRRKGRLDSHRLQEIENRSAVQAVTDDAEDLLDILDNYGTDSSSGKSPPSGTDPSSGKDAEAAEGSGDKHQSGFEKQGTDTVVKPVLAVVESEEDADSDSAGLSSAPVLRRPDEAQADPDEVDFSSATGIGTDEFEGKAQAPSDSQTADDGDDGDTLVAESEEVSDPELKLDLARAYLSLGDKEAAKSMLDEVLLNGNEEQVAEAEQMLDEL